MPDQKRIGDTTLAHLVAERCVIPVVIDCYSNKQGEVTFANRPADFPKLVTKAKKCNADGKEGSGTLVLYCF